jgi:hypothetical protein
MTGETKVLLGLGVLAVGGFMVAKVVTAKKPSSSSSGTQSAKLPPPYSDLLTYRGRTIAVWVLSGPAVAGGIEWRYAILTQPQADVLAMIQNGTDLLGVSPEPVTWGHTMARETAIGEAKAQLDTIDGAQTPGLSLGRRSPARVHHHMRSRWG